MENTAHLAVGRAGEAEAEAFLQKRGWKILSRNWRPSKNAGSLQLQSTRHKLLELDIVARDGDTIVFVEVKTRSLPQKGPRPQKGPESAVCGIPAYAAFTPKKQNLLVKSASLYCAEHNTWEEPLRFDLICAYRQPEGRFSLEHYRDVIEFGQTLGGSDTAWQPW